MSFDTPLQIFGRDIKNSFRITQQRNNFPQQVGIYDLNTGVVNETRVFAATYNTNIDWTPEFALPALARNRFNLTPSVSLQNVDPGPFWVASERTNGQFVHQSKRLTYGLSASPTIFGLFRGVGPFERFRHSITPSIGYNYAHESEVSDEYLLALGRTKFGYLGNLRAECRQLRADAERRGQDSPEDGRHDRNGKGRHHSAHQHHDDAAQLRLRARAPAGRALEMGGPHDGQLGLFAELGASARIRFLQQLLALPGKHAQ